MKGSQRDRFNAKYEHKPRQLCGYAVDSMISTPGWVIASLAAKMWTTEPIRCKKAEMDDLSLLGLLLAMRAAAMNARATSSNCRMPTEGIRPSAA